MKIKELGLKENHEIQNIGTEESQGNKLVDQRQVLKIWENYDTEVYDPAKRPENLEVEPEDDVDADEIGPYILHSEMEKSIKEVTDKESIRDDDVPRDVLRLLGEDGLRILTQLVNNMHETGQWPSDFTESAVIALKKKPEATKCSDHHTIILITHTAKIVWRILRRRVEMKIEDAHGEDQFRFRRGKATSAVEMLRTISAGSLDVFADEELCACFIDW